MAKSKFTNPGKGFVSLLSAGGYLRIAPGETGVELDAADPMVKNLVAGGALVEDKPAAAPAPVPAPAPAGDPKKG